MIYDSSKRGNNALDELREVFHYRDLIALLAQRDIATRYKRSVLGYRLDDAESLGMMIVLIRRLFPII